MFLDECHIFSTRFAKRKVFIYILPVFIASVVAHEMFIKLFQSRIENVSKASDG